MKWYEKQNTEGGDELVQSFASTNPSNYDKEGDTMGKENYKSYNTLATSISSDVSLIGNLISKEDVHMSGNIKGDVVCSKCLFVNGVITGNVSSNTLQLEDAIIKGDIICNLDATINEGTKIEGNIKADSLIIGGSIEGNLTIKGELQLLSSAIIKGDVEASSLESQKGSVIKGLCNIIV